jgi:thiol:disulfide interchange protein
MENMNANDFKTKVFNYETSKEWKFQGQIPAIIDFYADWCGHCKKMKPEWDETAEKVNKEKKRMIKINVGEQTDEQQALLAKYHIDGFPTVLIFQNGTASSYQGDYKEAMFVKMLE